MASAKFLEEALRTDVDESTVNAIVGSLDTTLVTSPTNIQQEGTQFSNINNLSINNNINHINNSAIVSNGPITSQKHHGVTIANEVSSQSVVNNHCVITSADIKLNNNNNSELTNVVTAQQHFSTTNPTQITTISSNNNTPIMSKNNEPVKLVYPSQQTGGGTQPAVINMNNRVTFTSQSLPNGTINLTTPQQHQQTLMQTSSAMTVVSGGPMLKTTAQQQHQQPQQSHLVIQKQVNH